VPKLLSTAYFPPVSYFAAIAEEMSGLSYRRDGDGPMELSPSVVYIEACENYQKQSYRNRCRFYAADGVQALSFPVIHEGGTYKHPVKDIKIDYSTPWLLQHKRAIVSAYRTSAYFEYYQDELFAILDSCPEKLLDLNMALLSFFIDKIGLKVDLRLTEEYSKDVHFDDLREVIHPKRQNSILKDMGLEKPYFQVFAPKYGFQSDLSIMDLLFNEGPGSILYLKRIPR
jgi:hypothetical protein